MDANLFIHLVYVDGAPARRSFPIWMLTKRSEVRIVIAEPLTGQCLLIFVGSRRVARAI
jgi:hypothetical protein